MAGTMLATVLAAGLTAQGWDGSGDGARRSIEDLKRAVEQLRKEQHEQQVDELKQKISELRSEKTEQKIDDLRRAVEGHHRHHPWMLSWHHSHHRHPGRRMPRAAESPPNRAVVTVSVPPGATLFANDKEIPVSHPGGEFLTPELERGKTYYYDFRVKVSREGRVETRAKRVSVSAGSEARLAYEDMTPERQ
jgi:uncharacterized protein (TIGR03000 family)